MREIKFRVFNYGKMWYPETKTVDNNDTFFAIYNNKEKTIGWGLYDMKLENRLVSGEYDAVLMQFTGLLDKNGKEIYEGDIVTIYDPYTKSQHTDAIIWDDPNCRYAIKNTYIDFDFLIEDEVIIVGNIYENPDLIKTE